MLQKYFFKTLPGIVTTDSLSLNLSAPSYSFYSLQ